MRSLPAALVVVALAVASGSPGCEGERRCTAAADCPAQSHCVLDDGGVTGTCRQECQATADCRDPARRCNSLGQCVPWEIPLHDAGEDVAAGDAAPPDDASPGDDSAPPDDAAPLDDASGTD